MPKTPALAASSRLALGVALLLSLGACSPSPPPPSTVAVTSQQLTTAPAPTIMTQDQLHATLEEIATDFDVQGNVVQFTFRDVPLICISDPGADRMRIFTPIVAEDQLTDEQRQAVLAANFHTALDARYAVSNGTLFGLFLHPLSSLNEEFIQLAAYQVANLKLTFGSEYSGGTLVFPGSSESAAPAPSNPGSSPGGAPSSNGYHPPPEA